MEDVRIVPIEDEPCYAVFHWEQELENGDTLTHQIYERLAAVAVLEDANGGEKFVGVLEDGDWGPYPTLVPEVEGNDLRCLGYASKTALDLRSAVLYGDRLEEEKD